MSKILSYLKPYTLAVIFIVLLLFTQAISELMLPAYMSGIVDTGISRSGIESGAPEAVSVSSFDFILSRMPGDKEKELFTSGYTLADKGQFSGKYPLNETEKIYVFTARKEMAKSLAETFEALDLGRNIADFVRNEYITLGVDVNKLQINYLLKSGGVMLLISLAIMVCVIIGAYLSSKVSAAVGRNLRNDLFSKVARFSNKNFDKFSASTLITRCTNDVQQIQQSIMMILRMVLFAPLMGIGGIIMVLRAKSQMTWIIAISVAAIFGLVSVMFSVASPKFKISQKLLDKVNLVVREALSGMLVIRAFGRQEFEEKKFDEANRNLTDVNLFIGRLMGSMFPAMSIIMNFTTVAILWFGAGVVGRGVVEIGALMAFIQYAMQIMFSFMMISMISIMLPRALVSATRIVEILNEQEHITDPVNAKKPVGAKKGSVEFRKVYFKYPGAAEYVLEDINFTARAGETTAIIGSTGSGKSTVINLIPRFYDVTEGEILVEGVDVRETTQADLRSSIGYVPQKGILFSGTIESNIKYADENIPDDTMEKSASIAQADFIYEKEYKFLEHISQGGTNVSGGQRQRLSIARALAKMPHIFIFDDSFSALDYKTDASLRRALKEELSGATVIIVAQRISTIRNADQIIVMDDGKIVGCGTHDELLKTCEVYVQIASSQLSSDELDGLSRTDTADLSQTGNLGKNSAEGRLSYE